MSMKPMNIMNPPKIRMIDAGRQAEDRGRVGEHRLHEPGAATNRKPARPIGRKPTT